MENKKIQIPDGWERIKFSENVFFQEGPGLMATLFKETGFPFMNIRCIENGKIKKENCQFVSDSIAENQYKHFQLQEDDLIVSTSGTLGKKAFVRKSDLPLLLNTSIIRFRPKYENAINLHFLNYILESYSFLYDLYSQSTGSAQVNVGPTHIKKVFVTLPKSTTEQKKIAEILSKVDTAIEQTQSLIAKYQRIKTGLMQDLLTKGIDGNGNIRSEETHEFKDSELGRIPKEWDCLELEKCCSKIQDGTHFSPKTDKNGKYKYLTSKNIRFGYLDLNNIEYLNEDAHSLIYKSCPVQLGDVLLTKDGANTGNICINTLQEEFSLLSSVAMIRGKEHFLINDYIVQFFMEEKGQKSLVDQMSGNAITRITLTKINKTLISFPEEKEQKKIIEILKQKDSLTLDEKAKLEKLQSIKTALMQDLLSGKKRVTSIINGEL